MAGEVVGDGVVGPLVETAGITVTFGGIHAVSDVAIRVDSAEIVGLIGTNGAGKSTFMNAIGGYVPSQGRVQLLGGDVSARRPHARAQRGLGRSFQAATLFPELTVHETVQLALEARHRTWLLPAALALPRATRQERRRRAEADELIDFLGLGRYADTYVSDHSTGTRRIVELAGLLALDARLLCLDEPTAGLAQRETEATGPLIEEIRRELDAAVLVVEHDMPLVMGISDRVYCLVARPGPDDGTSGRFDLVVGWDGIGSAIRERVFGPQPGFDAGWVLWTWWADAGHFDAVTVREFWGRGWFFGAYPAPGQVMCAAGGPAPGFAATGGGARADNGAAVAALLRDRIEPLAGIDTSIAGAIDDLDRAYGWPMRDVRSGRSSDGRVAVCGDAAVGFLPTAGVGASNALRGAAALADELSRADASSIPLALELYEKRCRSVVERNQTDSRRLARLMFVRSKPIGWARDQLARRYKPEKVLAQIIDSAHEPF